MGDAKRASGRSLSDFWLEGVEGRLHPGEQKLLEACARGEVCVLGVKRPEVQADENLVRAGLVRFLALGGDEDNPVHEQGVWLQGAWIDEPLDMEAAEVPHRLGLWHCRIEHLIARDARLRGLYLDGSCIEAGLAGDRMNVNGSVFLRDGFRAAGEVALARAEIGGNLDCSNGSFGSAEDAALVCDGASVKGVFFFLRVKKLAGAVLLSSFHAGTLVDDRDSWKGAQGRLVLDGFTYGRIDGNPAFTGAEGRIAWLQSQRPDQLADEFRPQPWEQLIKVLREMGHPNEARTVAIAKQRALRKANRFPPWERRLHWVNGALTSYGYRPLRIGKWLGGLLVGASLLFTVAVRPGDLRWYGNGDYWIEPAAARPDLDCIAALPATATTDDQKKCPPKPPAMNEFFAPAYALDALLPVVNLGYKTEWRPNRSAADGDPLIGGWAVQVTLWFLTLFGWVAGALIVVALGGLVRKD